MKPSEITESLYDAIDLQIPVFLWGPPGVGKSDVVAQVAARYGRELRDIRMGTMDPTDIKGFPAPDLKKRLMSWLPPDFLPTDKKSEGIIFFDEMNTAPQAVQASAYQLFLNRRVGDYHLPDGWTIVAAGNREQDRSIVHRMPAALANRMLHLEFDVDLEEWVSWARKNDAHPMLVAFLRFRSALIHAFDPNSKAHAFATPRSWMYVNKILNAELPPSRTFNLCKAAVGEGTAIELQAFLQVAHELPTIDQIKLAPKTTEVPASPAARHAVSSMLADATVTGEAYSRFIHYVTRMPKEFQVVYNRDVSESEHGSAVKYTPEWTEWCAENADVIL